MKYLVDSDYVVDYLKGRSPVTQLLSELFSDGLAISIITFAEVYEGIYYGQKPSYYAEIFQRFLHGVPVEYLALDCHAICSSSRRTFTQGAID
jgi:tRNA(fMet)-specific endonuclease VapC